MTLDKQTAVVVLASTGIGFLFDVLLYSMAQSEAQGGGFALSMPRGKDLLQLLAVEVVAGLLIDFSIKQLEYAMMSDQERAMTKLVDTEVYNIRTGMRQGVMPAYIHWERQVPTAANLT